MRHNVVYSEMLRRFAPTTSTGCSVFTNDQGRIKASFGPGAVSNAGPLQTYNHLTTPTNCRPQNCGPGCCSTPSTFLNAALPTTIWTVTLDQPEVPRPRWNDSDHAKRCNSCNSCNDDILLLAPTIRELQRLLHICESELIYLDMTINAKKSCCIRIGPRNRAVCAPICCSFGVSLPWVEELRYLGIFITRSRVFKISLDHAKKSFYRSANAIFGKVGRVVNEDVLTPFIVRSLPRSAVKSIMGLFSCRPHSLELSLPDFIRDPTMSADCFRRLLKTYLFAWY